MTKAVLVLHGKPSDAASDSEPVVVATVFAPEVSDDGHHFSRVSLPTLFPDEKRLFGVDGDQAMEIAEMVARDVLKGFGVSITAETALGDWALSLFQRDYRLKATT